jgi:hypothetical protein
MTEGYNPKEIEACWRAHWDATRRDQIDLGGASHLFYNLMEFPYPSGEGVIKFRSTTRNTPRVHVFAAAPWGLRLHRAKVSGITPPTLPYAHVGQFAYGEASLAQTGDSNGYPHYPL